jgi:hypothetical protein
MTRGAKTTARFRAKDMVGVVPASQASVCSSGWRMDEAVVDVKHCDKIFVERWTSTVSAAGTEYAKDCDEFPDCSVTLGPFHV